MVSMAASPISALARAQRARSSVSRTGLSATACSASRTRVRNSAAAASVKVIATSWDMLFRPLATNSAMRSTIAVVLPVPAPASTKSVFSKSLRSVFRARESASSSSGFTFGAQLELDKRSGPISFSLAHLVAAGGADAVERAVHTVRPAHAAWPLIVWRRHLWKGPRPEPAIHNIQHLPQALRVVPHLDELETPLRANEP